MKVPITLRSIVFLAVMLAAVAGPAAAAEARAGAAGGAWSAPAQSLSDPLRDGTASLTDVTNAEDDDTALVPAEPDFRVLNLPSTLRLPLHGSNFQLTHRFNGNLRRGSFGTQAGNLFGLDQGAVVGVEYRFGVMRHLQAAVYRTATDKAIQFFGKYDAVRQGGPMPVSLSALASVEGVDNFRARYSPAMGLVVSRTAGDRLAVYATPVWVHNTAGTLDTNRDTVFVGIGARVRVTDTVYVVGEVVPRTGGYRPDKAAYGFGFETLAGGHLFQINFNNGQGTTFAQLARGGFPDTLYLGFNLARKFF
jgi:hypothetical protein